MPQPLPEDRRARPTVLGNRYELGRLIGRGGTAEVYQGRDLLLDRTVAVKLLGQVPASPEDERVQRLLREARAAAALSHPHAVAVHDIGLSAQAMFVVMEYLDGESLRELLAREHRLPAPRAVQIACQVAGALDAAHRRGLVHRDVTPANIMICADGTAKVLDFGIARFAEDASVTATGMIIGTPAYMSPEQVQSGAVDGRTDVYALGCCLYHLLTGRPPFVGSDAAAVAFQHVNESPPAPGSVRPDVPPQLAAVVLRALAKRPEDRYQSAAELRSALEPDAADTTAPRLGQHRTLTLPDHGPVARDQDQTARIAQPTEDGLAEPDPADADRGTLRRRIGVVMIVSASATLLVVAALLLHQAFLVR